MLQRTGPQRRKFPRYTRPTLPGNSPIELYHAPGLLPKNFSPAPAPPDVLYPMRPEPSFDRPLLLNCIFSLPGASKISQVSSHSRWATPTRLFLRSSPQPPKTSPQLNFLIPVRKTAPHTILDLFPSTVIDANPPLPPEINTLFFLG